MVAVGVVIPVEQRRYKEAEPLYRQSLVIRRKALGPYHRDVASSLSNLANVLQSTRRYAEALALAKQALQDLRAKLPSAHRYTKWARDVLKRVSLPAISVSISVIRG